MNRISPSRMLLTGMLSFLGTLAFAPYLIGDYYGFYMIGVGAVGVFFISGWRTQLLFALGIGAIASSIACGRLYLEQGDEALLLAEQVYYEKPFSAVMVVDKESLLHERYQRLVVRSADGLVRARVLLDIKPFPKYRAGDVMNVDCKKPKPLEQKGWGRYVFRRNNVVVQCSHPTVSPRNEKRISVFHIFGGMRDSTYALLRKALPEPNATFVAGLLLGTVGALPPALTDAFRSTGLMHVMAVSGYNIAIVSVLLYQLFLGLRLGRKQSVWLVIGGLIFFALLAGATSSVVRACIMGLLVLVARSFGRTGNAVNALLFAATIMLLADPTLLLEDASFQLSFLATAGLLFIAPIVDTYLPALTRLAWARDGFIQTSSAIIATAPLVASTFGTFSVISPLANVLLTPLVPLIMALSAVEVAVSFMASFAPYLEGVSAVMAWPVWLSSQIFLSGVLLLSKVPGASLSFDLGSAGPLFALSLYGALSLYLLRNRAKHSFVAR